MSRLDSRVRKNGHWRYIFCSNKTPSLLGLELFSLSFSCRNACTAEPKPYQPGKVSRHWPQLKPQGIARRSSMRCEALRDAGREPMLSSAISRIGVALKKYSVKPGVSYTSAR